MWMLTSYTASCLVTSVKNSDGKMATKILTSVDDADVAVEVVVSQTTK